MIFRCLVILFFPLMAMGAGDSARFYSFAEFMFYPMTDHDFASVNPQSAPETAVVASGFASEVHNRLTRLDLEGKVASVCARQTPDFLIHTLDTEQLVELGFDSDKVDLALREDATTFVYRIAYGRASAANRLCRSFVGILTYVPLLPVKGYKELKQLVEMAPVGHSFDTAKLNLFEEVQGRWRSVASGTWSPRTSMYRWDLLNGERVRSPECDDIF